MEKQQSFDNTIILCFLRGMYLHSSYVRKSYVGDIDEFQRGWNILPVIYVDVLKILFL